MAIYLIRGKGIINGLRGPIMLMIMLIGVFHSCDGQITNIDTNPTGTFDVYMDGVLVPPRHQSLFDAQSHALDLKIQNPESKVTIGSAEIEISIEGDQVTDTIRIIDTIIETRIDTIIETRTDTIIKEKEVPVYVTDTIIETRIDTIIKEKEVPVYVTDTIIETRIDTVAIMPPVEIDTIQVHGSSHLIDHTRALTGCCKDKPPFWYAHLHEIGIVKTENDTLFNWQKLFNVKREKHFDGAFTKYTALNDDIPFHVTNARTQNVTSNSVDIWVWMTEPHSEVYVEIRKDGTEEIQTSAKGIDNIASAVNLEPGTRYWFRVIATSKTGETYRSWEYLFTTLNE